jgi:nanoRNase/pAp phosphatase (c-di-AMP/oligoRNAs hydrolase)
MNKINALFNDIYEEIFTVIEIYRNRWINLLRKAQGLDGGGRDR